MDHQTEPSAADAKTVASIESVAVSPISYATPAARPVPRLAASVWMCVFGLGTIVVGGIFLIGVLAATEMSWSSRRDIYLAFVYAAATVCLLGGSLILALGVTKLLKIASQSL